MNILITNSFILDDGNYNFIVAQTIGKIISVLPLHWKYQVHPAIRMKILKELFQRKWNILVHFGYEKHEKGMRDITDWQYVLSFPSQNLDLAIFLCCQSSRIAQSLVKHGYLSRAIGFPQEIRMDICHSFITEIIHNLALWPMDTAYIRSGFDYSCRQLENVSLEKPTLFLKP